MATERIIFVPQEDEERIRRVAVEEARTWLLTPYHHWGEVKGVGVDCAHLLLAVYKTAGIDFHSLKPSWFDAQWFQHRDAREVLLNAASLFAGEVPGPPDRMPLPADIVFFRMPNSYVFNHSALVVAWPQVIHARPLGRVGKGWVEIADVGCDVLRTKHIKIFSLW